MHQFLWYAAHIHTGTTETPFGSAGCRFHEIQAGHFSSIRYGLLGTGQASRSATNYYQIVIEIILNGKRKESRNRDNITIVLYTIIVRFIHLSYEFAYLNVV